MSQRVFRILTPPKVAVSVSAAVDCLVGHHCCDEALRLLRAHMGRLNAAMHALHVPTLALGGGGSSDPGGGAATAAARRTVLERSVTLCQGWIGDTTSARAEVESLKRRVGGYTWAI